jgi:hypothetical protein
MCTLCAISVIKLFVYPAYRQCRSLLLLLLLHDATTLTDSLCEKIFGDVENSSGDGSYVRGMVVLFGLAHYVLLSPA